VTYGLYLRNWKFPSFPRRSPRRLDVASGNPVCATLDRGRESRLGPAPPPSEPDVRFSRIRLSG